MGGNASNRGPAKGAQSVSRRAFLSKPPHVDPSDVT
jgi:hypothetical protein